MQKEKLQFGWMTGTDADTLIKTMMLVNQSFPEGVINTLEIGVREGKSSKAIHKFFTDNKRLNFHTGLDNEHDIKAGTPFQECHYILGNSIDVYDQISDNSQHFIFQDANHSLFFTVADFLLYRNKLRIGGYYAFHDTSPNIKPFTDYQHVGDAQYPHNYISCREALTNFGIYENKWAGWELVYDEYDQKAPTGGVTILKRTK